MPTVRNKLLLVEDDHDYELIVRHLIGRIYDIVSVERMTDAIEKIRDDRRDACPTFHCALLDLTLPDSPPELTVSTLRSVCRVLPIVVVSGNENPAIISAAHHAGADDYLVKGYDDKDAGALIKSISMAVIQRATLLTLDRAKSETEFLRRTYA
jgi:DNA-binding response OmpR family regulator